MTGGLARYCFIAVHSPLSTGSDNFSDSASDIRVEGWRRELLSSGFFGVPAARPVGGFNSKESSQSSSLLIFLTDDDGRGSESTRLTLLWRGMIRGGDFVEIVGWRVEIWNGGYPESEEMVRLRR